MVRQNQMRLPLTPRRLAPLVALSPFLVYASGCYSWVTATVPARGQALNENPPVVRVVRHPRGSIVTLTNPVVIGDTLTGLSGTSANRVRVALPLSEVAGLQTREFSVARTVVLGVLLAGVVFLSLAAYGLSTLEP
jgi:hypothetical protein